jgi:hypothetical protein
LLWFVDSYLRPVSEPQHCSLGLRSGGGVAWVALRTHTRKHHHRNTCTPHTVGDHEADATVMQEDVSKDFVITLLKVWCAWVSVLVFSCVCLKTLSSSWPPVAPRPRVGRRRQMDCFSKKKESCAAHATSVLSFLPGSGYLRNWHVVGATAAVGATGAASCTLRSRLLLSFESLPHSTQP